MTSFLATRTKQTSWHTILLIGCNERKTFCPQSLQSSSSVIRKTFWNSSSQQKNHLVTCFPNNPIRKKTSASFFSFLHASEFSFDICLALLHACLLACCIPLQKKCLWKWASFYKLNNGLEIKTNRLSIKEFFFHCLMIRFFTFSQYWTLLPIDENDSHTLHWIHNNLNRIILTFVK